MQIQTITENIAQIATDIRRYRFELLEWNSKQELLEF